MGICCAVKNCPSGRYADRKRRKLKKLRPVSLFSVPKCPIKRQKWVDSLSQNLDVKQCVCELHFRTHDIKKETQTVITGNVTTSAKIRWTLNSDAIPSLQIEDNQESEEIIQEQITEIQSKLTIDNESQQLNDCLVENNEASESDVNEISVLTISDIKRHFKFLPEYWCYISGPTDINFIYLDPLTLTEKLRLTLDSNLSITVKFSEGREILLKKRLISMHELKKYFSDAENFIECTGINNERYSRCVGVGFINLEDKYARLQRFPKCKACRAYRNNL